MFIYLFIILIFFVIRILLSAFCHPHFIIRHPPSAIRHPPPSGLRFTETQTGTGQVLFTRQNLSEPFVFLSEPFQFFRSCKRPFSVSALSHKKAHKYVLKTRWKKILLQSDSYCPIPNLKRERKICRLLSTSSFKREIRKLHVAVHVKEKAKIGT